MSTADNARDEGLTTEQIATAGTAHGHDQFGAAAQPDLQAQPDMQAQPDVQAAQQGQTVPSAQQMPAQQARPDVQPARPLEREPGAPGFDDAVFPGQGDSLGEHMTDGPGDLGPASGEQAGGETASAAAPASDAASAAAPAGDAASASAPEGGVRADEDNRATLLAGGEMQSIVTRWKDIQADFVDEPRKAVEEADALVAELMQRLASMFAQERAGLEQRWAGGESVSTEDLRLSLRRYRSFFERLLAA